MGSQAGTLLFICCVKHLKWLRIGVGGLKFLFLKLYQYIQQRCHPIRQNDLTKRSCMAMLIIIDFRDASNTVHSKDVTRSQFPIGEAVWWWWISESLEMRDTQPTQSMWPDHSSLQEKLSGNTDRQRWTLWERLTPMFDWTVKIYQCNLKIYPGGDNSENTN